jgi:hypothetical protein
MGRLVLLALLLASFCGGNDALDNSAEWRQVLSQKRAAVSPQATAPQKQAYADSLAAFLTRHPSHPRAREVYRRVQLDFAEELAALGRQQSAIRFYRAVLTDDPQNREALHGLDLAIDRLTVSRQKLLTLERGMSQRQVAGILGDPIPGWTARTERPDCVMEAWYYRTTDHGVAGVYFRDGSVIAAEENSHAKVVPLSDAMAR